MLEIVCTQVIIYKGLLHGAQPGHFLKAIIMKKQLLVVALAAVFLAACGKKDEAPSAADQASAPASASSASAAVVNTEEKILNVYNWPDYIPKDTLANFEKATGIKVQYQTFETNEALHAKLVAGNTGYDIVVPGTSFAKPQIDGGLLQKFNKAAMPNFANLDTGVLDNMKGVDPNNEYLIPWAWSYTTVGINKGKVAKALGTTPMPENAWDLVFNPEYTKKLKSCGIAFLDSPTEILPPALHYIGKPAYTPTADDIKAVGAVLAKVRPDIRLFSSTMIDDLAGGKACVALGWAGDINIARARAIENKNGNDIEALIPKTGGLIFVDTMAIPKDAKHPQNAVAFMNFYHEAKNAAALTNELGYAAGNKAAMEHVEPALASNATMFPTPEQMKTMVPPISFTDDVRGQMSTAYTAFKKGK